MITEKIRLSSKDSGTNANSFGKSWKKNNLIKGSQKKCTFCQRIVEKIIKISQKSANYVKISREMAILSKDRGKMWISSKDHENMRVLSTNHKKMRILSKNRKISEFTQKIMKNANFVKGSWKISLIKVFQKNLV